MKKKNTYTILIIAAVVITAALFGIYKAGLLDMLANKAAVAKKSLPAKTDHNRHSENTDQENKTEEQQPRTSEPNDTQRTKDANDTPAVTDSNDPNDLLEALNLKDVEAKDIIKKLADWTGKVIIASDEVMQQKITIYSPKKLTRGKALAHIYSALYTKGIIAEQSEDIIYLKPIAKARLGSVPTVPAETPLASIEDKSQIVQKFFRLQNYSPAGMSEIILPLIGDYGYVTADENAGTLLVIDTVDNLIRLERIIIQFDVPDIEQTVTKIFTVKAADPVEIVDLLKMLLGQTTGPRRGGSRPSGAPPSSSKGAKTNELAASVIIETNRTPIILIPLPNQKWIIAKASVEDMEIIADWISKLDKEESIEPKQSTIQLRYVDAREVANIVKRALENMPVKTNVVVEPLPQTKQLVVFGSDENRRMVEKLIEQIDFPATDIFKEQTFKLKHADPDKIKENIDNLYEGAGDKINTRYYFDYGGRSSQKSMSPDTVKVISYPTLDQITVIASAENMKKIENQIAEWDIPIDVEKVKPRIIELRNSDPVRMTELLQTLFTEKSDSRGSFWDYIFGGSGAEEKKKIVGALYGQLTFEPVPDTKKIIIISNIPEAYDVVEDLIHRLDSMEVAELPMVVTLNYADAEDLCEQLNAILNEPGTPAALRRSKRGLSEYSTDASGQKKSEAAKDDSADAKDMISPWWNKARNRADEEMPTSNLIGKIRFIPVHRSKAILVLAPNEYLESIKEMIQILDQPGKQVMVKAIIIEINHDSMTSLGVRMSSNPDAFGAVGQNALSAFTQFTQTENQGSAFNLGNLSLKEGATSFVNVNTFVDLLIQETNAKILNQPTLWTKDNEEADFFKGGLLPFVVSSSTSAEGTATKDQVEYRPVGVTLRVRPNITPEKAVDMTINLIISQIDAANTSGSRIATTELNTTTHMIVADGETIMLGGILFQTDSKIEQKLPLLGDIPLIGALFRHYDTQQANQELIAFITPYVVDDNKTTATTEQIEQSQTKLQTVLEELSDIIDPNE